MDRRINRIISKRLLLADCIAFVISWLLFNLLRKFYFEPIKFGYSVPFEINLKLIISLIIIPSFWLLLTYFSGYYKNAIRKSYLYDISSTFIYSFLGSVALFFLVIIDDFVKDYNFYYYSLGSLFAIQFSIVLVFRLLNTRNKKKLMNSRQLSFNALVVGNGEKAERFIDSFINNKLGINIIGYVAANIENTDELQVKLLGTIDNIEKVINAVRPDDIIIALEPNEPNKIQNIIDSISYLDVNIKILPELYNYVQAKTEISGIFGESLIGVPTNTMAQWEYNLKVVIDYTASICFIIIMLPVFLIIALGIKFSSKGAIFYKQERIGKHGHRFKLYKFRSMHIDAEKHGPDLSRKDDDRVTPFGRLLRKTKLDEIPNFFNVLKGDLSLVGPRPERKFYIDQIVHLAPNYKKLQKIKPGITSLGQVKFGYAENVEQMVQRLRFDLIYLENMSIWTDLKIIFYTIRMMIKGRHI